MGGTDKNPPGLTCPPSDKIISVPSPPCVAPPRRRACRPGSHNRLHLVAGSSRRPAAPPPPSDAALRKKIGPPGSPEAANFAESNVYICPAAMLNHLHEKIGDKKFFPLAKAWVQTQKNTQQDRATFIAFVKKQTGQDHSKLINTWLDAKSTPA